MPNLVRYQPFRELRRFQREMDRLLEDMFGGWGRREEIESAFWAPADIHEDAERVEVKLDLPGIEAKDLDVRVENNVLTVRAERRVERKETKGTYHVTEREAGTFARSFTLPASVDATKCQAKLDKGVLTLLLPKRAEAQPKQIKIETT